MNAVLETLPGIEPGWASEVVPLTMSERYADKDGASEILGEARYSNFRQFTTAGRLITP